MKSLLKGYKLDKMKMNRMLLAFILGMFLISLANAQVIVNSPQNNSTTISGDIVYNLTMNYTDFKNDSNYVGNYSMMFGSFLNEVLNSKYNISQTMYEFSTEYPYSSKCSASEYPSKWQMVSNPQLNNTNYEITYNVTKNFAHLCPAGATVYVTSNDDDSIKQVSCRKNNLY